MVCQNNLNLLDISDSWTTSINGFLSIDLNDNMAILPLIKFKFLNCNVSMINLLHERNRGSSKQNIIDFQYDLIENGFGEFAKWKP